MNAVTSTPSTESTGKTHRVEAAGITKRSSAYFADPKAITRRPDFNPRFDFGEIEQLAASIKDNGLLQPLRVKRIAANEERAAAGFAFELIDGDRRLTAIELLVKKDGALPAKLVEGVPIIIVDKAQDEITDLIQMFEANTGKAFLPMEEAMAYDRMRKAGMTVKQICKAVHRKEMHVTEILALLEADEEVQTAVKNGEIGKTQAKQIAKHAKGDKGAQRTLLVAAKAVQKGDKSAKKTLDKGLDDARRKKAAAKGKALKIRALDDQELAQLGMSVGMRMKELMTNAGKPETFDLAAWVKSDDKLALAASFGALQALKAAAGMKKDVGGAAITLEF